MFRGSTSGVEKEIFALFGVFLFLLLSDRGKWEEGGCNGCAGVVVWFLVTVRRAAAKLHVDENVPAENESVRLRGFGCGPHVLSRRLHLREFV